MKLFKLFNVFFFVWHSKHKTDWTVNREVHVFYDNSWYLQGVAHPQHCLSNPLCVFIDRLLQKIYSLCNYLLVYKEACYHYLRRTSLI